MQRYLEKWKLPTVLLKKESLGESLALALLEEFAEAFTSLSALKKVLLGPFVRMALHEMTEEKVFQAKDLFASLQMRWEQEGFHACIAQFFNTYSCMAYYEDVMQILTKIGYPSCPLQLKGELHRLRLEEKEPRVSAHPHGIQIMTTHASKGLEFETVFALGVAWKTNPDEGPTSHLEELDAEKLRQFYVALTRAKKNLYVAFPQENNKSPVALGEASPLEIFWQKAAPDLAAFPTTDLNFFPFELKLYEETAPLASPSPRPSFFKPLLLQSFSSLAQASPAKKVPVNTLLPGAETGVIVHRILEKLWSPHLSSIIAEEVQCTHLQGHETTLLTLVQNLLDLPLNDFYLRDVSPEKTAVEMEFLFPTPSTLLKGFIDLCFEHKGTYYLIDWKTHALEDYTPATLHQCMTEHDYFLQGQIYATAFCRYLKLFGSPPFGGIFFVFVRGPAAYHFIPEVMNLSH